MMHTIPHHVNSEATPDILTNSYKYGASVLASDRHFRTERPLKTYLFGHPISHSLAPLLHQTLYDQHSVRWSFTLQDSLEINNFLPLLHSPHCIGSAVTMPHKVAFMPHVDALTEEATTIGAMNTIFIRLDPKTQRRKYIGTNTDCYGIREAFRHSNPLLERAAAGRKAAIIGGGGACRAAVYALGKWFGVSEIFLINRDAAEVAAVTNSFAEKKFPTRLTYVSSLAQARELETPVMIVGCVPDHPPATEAEREAREIVKEFLGRTEKGVVLEMCYHPEPRTEFFELSERAGWKVLPGTEMMIHQGVAQQVLWTERQDMGALENTVDVVRREVDRRVARAKLDRPVAV